MKTPCNTPFKCSPRRSFAAMCRRAPHEASNPVVFNPHVQATRAPFAIGIDSNPSRFTVIHGFDTTIGSKNLKRHSEFQVQFSFMQTVSFQASKSFAAVL